MMDRRSNLRNSAEAGFGVIELAIVVSVTAIIVTMSLLIFGKAKARYDLRHKAQSLAWQIDRARSIAIKRNQTLTMGFSALNQVFDLTCEDCQQAKGELPPFIMPGGVNLSSYPTLTIKGNGTITTTNSVITFNDRKDLQVSLTINNSGRVVVGQVTRISL